MPAVYDPASVSVIFGGHIVTGYADGTFVSVEHNEDSFSLVVGADGEACRARSNNKSARVTLTLLQSSLSNDFLSAQHNADTLTPAGDGIVPLIIRDSSGRTVHAAEKAWVVKPATSEFAREVGSREWTIETDAMVSQIGGN